MGRNRFNFMLLAIVLLAVLTDSKRIYSSNSGRRSSASSSSSVRRNTYNKPSSSNSHSTSHSSSSHSNPSLSHTGLTSLSYGGYNQQANRRPSNTGTWSATGSATNTHRNGQSSAPIGWNIPPKQGPPPPYSPTNPVGGARTNINEKPPAYNPHYSAPPSYPAATNAANRPAVATTHNQQYSSFNRNRFNSTGGSFGSNGYQTPISATNRQNVHSSYPTQQLPAGASYHPAGHLPAGATYYPAGHVPSGATFYPSSPVGGGLPAGTNFYSHGHLPQGATLYPSHSIPAAPAYYPSHAALPAGATLLPVGSVMPAGATLIQSPQKSSSGFGFGTGLLAGGLAGGLLGSALTPSHTRVIERTPTYVGGGGGGSYGNRDENNDKIIVINNGPPGSVTTTDLGGGTTVINTGAAQPQNPSSYNPPPAPYAEQPAQLSPINPNLMQSTPNGYGSSAVSAGSSVVGLAENTMTTSVTPQPTISSTGEQTAATGATGAPGNLICVVVKVPEPDPNDSSKIIEVEKYACYNQPEVSTPPTVAISTDNSSPTATSITAASNAASTTDTTGIFNTKLTTLEGGISLAPLQSTTPLNVPEGFVPLAPINNNEQPNVMKIPGYFNNMRSSALISDESGILIANSSVYNYASVCLVTILTFLVAICWK